jgi:hypothetical protein
LRDRSLDHLRSFQITIASLRARKSSASPWLRRLRLCHEKVPKQPLDLFQSFVCQGDGFSPPHGIRNQAFSYNRSIAAQSNVFQTR